MVMANVWLSYTYTPNLENLNLFLDMYKRSREFGPGSQKSPPAIRQEQARPGFFGIPASIPENANRQRGMGGQDIPVLSNGGNGSSNHVSFGRASNLNGAACSLEDRQLQRDGSSSEEPREQLRTTSQEQDTGNARHYYSDSMKNVAGVEQFFRTSN